MKILIIILALCISLDSKATCQMYVYNHDDGHKYYWSIGAEYGISNKKENEVYKSLPASIIISSIDNDVNRRNKGGGLKRTLINLSRQKTNCMAKDETLHKLFDRRLNQAISEIEAQNELLRRNLSISLSLQLDVIHAELQSLGLQVKGNSLDGAENTLVLSEISKLSNTIEKIKLQLGNVDTK